MSSIALASRLLDLLHGHAVEAEIRDDMVYLPSVDRWANLWMWRTDSGTFLMEVRATGEGAEVVADRWAALGDDPKSATRDGLESFCRCGFHVVLAALWGVLETDQVDHEVRQVGGHAWDLYLGPYTGRASVGNARLDAPPALVDRVLEALDGHLGTGSTHAMRVFVAVVNGAVTVEGLVDDEVSPAVEAAVAAADWTFPASGFASLRWFVMARRRDEAPAHRVTRSCGGS